MNFRKKVQKPINYFGKPFLSNEGIQANCNKALVDCKKDNFSDQWL